MGKKEERYVAPGNLSGKILYSFPVGPNSLLCITPIVKAVQPNLLERQTHQVRTDNLEITQEVNFDDKHNILIQTEKCQMGIVYLARLSLLIRQKLIVLTIISRFAYNYIPISILQCSSTLAAQRCVKFNAQNSPATLTGRGILEVEFHTPLRLKKHGLI